MNSIHFHPVEFVVFRCKEITFTQDISYEDDGASYEDDDDDEEDDIEDATPEASDGDGQGEHDEDDDDEDYSEEDNVSSGDEEVDEDDERGVTVAKKQTTSSAQKRQKISAEKPSNSSPESFLVRKMASRANAESVASASARKSTLQPEHRRNDSTGKRKMQKGMRRVKVSRASTTLVKKHFDNNFLNLLREQCAFLALLFDGFSFPNRLRNLNAFSALVLEALNNISVSEVTATELRRMLTEPRPGSEDRCVSVSIFI